MHLPLLSQAEPLGSYSTALPPSQKVTQNYKNRGTCFQRAEPPLLQHSRKQFQSVIPFPLLLSFPKATKLPPSAHTLFCFSRWPSVHDEQLWVESARQLEEIFHVPVSQRYGTLMVVRFPPNTALERNFINDLSKNFLSLVFPAIPQTR